MPIEKRMLKKSAVLWAVDGIDLRGELIFTPPEEIKCFWIDVNEQYLDEKGETLVSNAKVFVDRPIAVGSKMRRGTIDELEEIRSPDENSGVYRVNKSNEIPANLKQTRQVYMVFL